MSAALKHRGMGALQENAMQPQTDPQPRSVTLRGLVDYWRTKSAGGTLPGRRDLDPMEMRAWLAHILLVDVKGEPRRFRWRLVGTHLTEAVGHDSSGLWFEDVYEGAVLDRFLQIYNQVVDCRDVVRTAGLLYFPKHHDVPAEAVNMPLASDGRNVDMVLTGLAIGVPLDD